VPDRSRFFWLRDGLGIEHGRLVIAGRDAEAIARERGTPLYVYDLDRVEFKLRSLTAALDGAELRHAVRFAVKANHHPQVLAVVRELGAGIDASSPGEVELALREGFSPERVSFTGTNVSDSDLDALLATAVGIRVNPRAGGAYAGGGETLYSGAGPTKFGIYEEGLDEALTIAVEYELTIDTVHMHVGDGFLDDGLPGFEAAVERLAAIVRRLVDAGCPIGEVNTGGGLGGPQAPGERPLDLAAYAAVLARHLGPLDVVVACEPGDFLVKDSAILLCEVITVEDRLGTPFVGLDAGWNIMPDAFVYDVSPDMVLCRAVDQPPVAEVTVAGHINEGDDLFGERVPMPDVREGDIVAMIDVGGYHQAMSSTHCMRPHAQALFLRG
jgi:diaminopimelate decarboxylase